MGRVKKSDEERRVQVNAGMLPGVAAEIDAIAASHYLTRSRAAELLILRGLAAYSRDGQLTEGFSIVDEVIAVRQEFVKAHMTDLEVGADEIQPSLAQGKKKKIA